MISVGERAPTAHVEDARGRVVAVPDEARGAPVLAFLHPHPCDGCDRFVEDLEGARERFAGWDGRVLVVGDAGWRSQTELAVDGEGDLRASYGLGPSDAGVAIADRFGQVFAATEVSGDHGWPDVEGELLEEVRFLGVQCPECDVDDVPPGLFS